MIKSETVLNGPVQEAARKPAPMVGTVGDVYGDDRSAILNGMSKNDKDFVYAYERAGVTAEELWRKGAEIVKDSAGRTTSHGGDLVVKIPRERFEKQRRFIEEKSIEGARKMARDENALKQVAAPKTPRKRRQDSEED